MEENHSQTFCTSLYTTLNLLAKHVTMLQPA